MSEKGKVHNYDIKTPRKIFSFIIIHNISSFQRLLPENKSLKKQMIDDITQVHRAGVLFCTIYIQSSNKQSALAQWRTRVTQNTWNIRKTKMLRQTHKFICVRLGYRAPWFSGLQVLDHATTLHTKLTSLKLFLFRCF